MQIESEIATSNLKVATKSSKQIFSRNNYCIIPKVDFVKVIANSIKFINQMACGSWWFHSIRTVWSKLKASICIQIQLKSCLYLYSVCLWIHLITETSECFLFLKGFLFFFHSNFTGIVFQHRFIQNQIENGCTILEYQMRTRVFSCELDFSNFSRKKHIFLE